MNEITRNEAGILQYNEELPFSAVNWNKPDDEYTKDVIDTAISAFWVDDRLSFSEDALDWMNMSEKEKETYMYVFGGLTLLDTKQSSIGMNTVSIICNNEQRRMAFNNFVFMESIHAKMYSSVFTTLLSKEEINDVFDWVKQNPFLQKKVSIVEAYYRKALRTYVENFEYDPVTVYLCMACSVMLESFLFYSGFYYPLYKSGQGKMRASGEGIGLICRDEAVHGLYTGAVSQEVFADIPDELKPSVVKEVNDIFKYLFENEVDYTREMYEELGMFDEVVTFLKYNGNLAFDNLGLEQPFPEITDEDVNPIVLNGLSNVTVTQDFFSNGKGIGNGYSVATNVERLRDEHFEYTPVDEFED